MVKAVAWFFGIVIAITVALVGYDQLDINGYIHHDRTLDVYMTGNWLVGENRTCWLNQRSDANGKPTGQLDNLNCPVGFDNLAPHNVSVTFKGVLDPKDMDGQERPIPAQWKCTRGSESFSCEPLAP